MFILKCKSQCIFMYLIYVDMYAFLFVLAWHFSNKDFLMFKSSGRNCDKMVGTDVTWWQEWWQLSGIKSNCPDVVTNNILTTFNLQCNQFRKIMTSLMIQAISYIHSCSWSYILRESLRLLSQCLDLLVLTLGI